jgi:hypothetical protein
MLITGQKAEVRVATIYSRSDGIVDESSCLDPDAEQIEVESSHCGTGVNAEVYRVLQRLLASRGTPLNSRPTGRPRPG